MRSEQAHKPNSRHMGAKQRSMDCDDDAFARIVLTLNGPCACSPRFAPGEAEGIKIAMPKRVPMRIVDGSVAPQARLPLCIAAQFNELFLSQFHPRPLRQVLRLVLVDEERGETFAGSPWRERSYRADAAPNFSDEQLAARMATHFWNVNVFEFVRLPVRAARYTVHVALGDRRSDPRTVELTVKLGP